MPKRVRGRNPLFAKRWFGDQVIILLVRWYLRFRLSYRDLASIAAEMGISVAPSTILRWVIRYTEEFVSRWAPFELVVGRSWRADDTYIKVNSGWVYLYAARNFFRQALKRHGEPRSITLDGFEPSHTASESPGSPAWLGPGV